MSSAERGGRQDQEAGSFLASPRVSDQARADTQKLQIRFDEAIADALSTAAADSAACSLPRHIRNAGESLPPRDSSLQAARAELSSKFDLAIAETLADLPPPSPVQPPMMSVHGEPMDISPEAEERVSAGRCDAGVTAAVAHNGKGDAQHSGSAVTDFSTASSKGSTHTADTLPAGMRADDTLSQAAQRSYSQASPLPVRDPPDTHGQAASLSAAAQVRQQSISSHVFLLGLPLAAGSTLPASCVVPNPCVRVPVFSFRL